MEAGTCDARTQTVREICLLTSSREIHHYTVGKATGPFFSLISLGGVRQAMLRRLPLSRLTARLPSVRPMWASQPSRGLAVSSAPISVFDSNMKRAQRRRASVAALERMTLNTPSPAAGGNPRVIPGSEFDYLKDEVADRVVDRVIVRVLARKHSEAVNHTSESCVCFITGYLPQFPQSNRRGLWRATHRSCAGACHVQPKRVRPSDRRRHRQSAWFHSLASQY